MERLANSAVVGRVASEVSDMTNKQSYRLAITRADDILAATDLLRRMMCELHSLPAATASPLLKGN